MAGYGRSSYYEADKEVVRGPYSSAEYRVQEYGNSGYPVPLDHRHHHHNPGYTDKVSEVVSYETNPSYCGHSHHGRPAEYVEKREETVYEKVPYDSYRRGY